MTMGISHYRSPALPGHMPSPPTLVKSSCCHIAWFTPSPAPLYPPWNCWFCYRMAPMNCIIMLLLPPDADPVYCGDALPVMGPSRFALLFLKASPSPPCLLFCVPVGSVPSHYCHGCRHRNFPRTFLTASLSPVSACAPLPPSDCHVSMGFPFISFCRRLSAAQFAIIMLTCSYVFSLEASRAT